MLGLHIITRVFSTTIIILGVFSADPNITCWIISFVYCPKEFTPHFPITFSDKWSHRIIHLLLLLLPAFIQFHLELLIRLTHVMRRGNTICLALFVNNSSNHSLPGIPISFSWNSKLTFTDVCDFKFCTTFHSAFLSQFEKRESFQRTFSDALQSDQRLSSLT